MTDRKLTELPIRYQTGTPNYVPIASYRCKATAEESNHPGRKHLCKLHIDHHGDHECVCKKLWEPLEVPS